jgi:hypothetical protein
MDRLVVLVKNYISLDYVSLNAKKKCTMEPINQVSP